MPRPITGWARRKRRRQPVWSGFCDGHCQDWGGAQPVGRSYFLAWLYRRRVSRPLARLTARTCHTAPSISITEGRTSGSAVHHRCVPNDVADGKWSLQLLHVLVFRVRFPGMEHQGERSRVNLLSRVKGSTNQRFAMRGLSMLRHTPKASLRATGLEVQCATECVTLGDAQPSGSVPSRSGNDRMQSDASSVRIWLLLRVADTCGGGGGVRGQKRNT